MPGHAHIGDCWLISLQSPPVNAHEPTAYLDPLALGTDGDDDLADERAE